MTKLITLGIFEWSVKMIKIFSTLVLFLWMQFYFLKGRTYSGKYELTVLNLILLCVGILYRNFCKMLLYMKISLWAIIGIYYY